MTVADECTDECEAALDCHMRRFMTSIDAAAEASGQSLAAIKVGCRPTQPPSPPPIRQMQRSCDSVQTAAVHSPGSHAGAARSKSHELDSSTSCSIEASLEPVLCRGVSCKSSSDYILTLRSTACIIGRADTTKQTVRSQLLP